ncbi:hypothetical protein ACFLS9_09150 [Bacteroidota bacterium]
MKKRDSNQKKIERFLRAVGISYFDTSQIGRGFPDIVIGIRGRNYLFEIKNPEVSKSGQKLTESEEKFHQIWGGQIKIVRTIEDVISEIKM